MRCTFCLIQLPKKKVPYHVDQTDKVCTPACRMCIAIRTDAKLLVTDASPISFNGRVYQPVKRTGKMTLYVHVNFDTMTTTLTVV